MSENKSIDHSCGIATSLVGDGTVRVTVYKHSGPDVESAELIAPLWAWDAILDPKRGDWLTEAVGFLEEDARKRGFDV